MNFRKALKSLRPTSKCVVMSWEDYDSIQWLDEENPIPTRQELEAEAQRLQDLFESTQYQRDRAVQYPKIADQLDMLWHAIDSGTLNKTSDFYTAIKAVKDAHPKE
jgi:hypothetical protein